MKNYDEMANSIFERREKFQTEKSNKRKKLVKTLTPICFVCIVLLGVGIWHSEMLKSSPVKTADDSVVEGVKDWYGPGENEPSANNSIQNEPPNNSFCDLLGMIIYKNETYIQISSINIDDIELDKKIGSGEDFEGTWNSEWLKKRYDETGIVCYGGETVKAEIYTVANNDDLLCAVLENGAHVILKRTVD